MQYAEKIELLKAIPILGGLPERQLAGLTQFLKPKEAPDGSAVFEEDSVGMSLYFISSGEVRISKRSTADASVDLAVLGPGEFFGESALIEEAFRSASAIAVGPCVLFELFRGDLGRWTKLYPQNAMQFFAELLNAQSRRLRRTSDELALHCELSNLLLDPAVEAPNFLRRLLERVIAHLKGQWSGAAYLRREAGAKAHLVAAAGKPGLEGTAEKFLATGEAAKNLAWLDASTLHAPIMAWGSALGSIFLRAATPVAKHDLDDIARTVSSVSRLASHSLEMIALRAQAIRSG